MPILIDVGHRLAERAPHPSLAHVGGEAQHLFAHADDIGHHVLAVDQDRLAVEIAQCGVQDGALLGRVDLLAANIASRLASTLAALASSTSALRTPASMRCFE